MKPLRTDLLIGAPKFCLQHEEQDLSTTMFSGFGLFLTLSLVSSQKVNSHTKKIWHKAPEKQIPAVEK